MAYPLVDPVIVADTDGSGFIPADAALQANEASVGFPTANLPIPPIPPGVHFQALTNKVARSLTAPRVFHNAAAALMAVDPRSPVLAPGEVNQLDFDLDSFAAALLDPLTSPSRPLGSPGWGVLLKKGAWT